jgi:GT2 family glycosyltransferase
MIHVAPRVTAVLVNWQQPERTLAAIAALRAQTVRPSIVVVDNGSGDGSIDRLRAGLGDDVTLIAQPRNAGFGGGCNPGMRYAIANDADFVWLINNDAVPAPDCLERVLASARLEASALIGCRLTDPAHPVNDHAGSVMAADTLSCRAFLDPGAIDDAQFAWLTAASLLIPAATIRQVGGFDENFFMYWEDADYCMRARSAGFRLAVAADALVTHAAGTSSASDTTNRYRWHYQSLRYWLSKHHPKPRRARAVLFARYAMKAIFDRDLRRLQMIVREARRPIPIARIAMGVDFVAGALS